MKALNFKITYLIIWPSEYTQRKERLPRFDFANKIPTPSANRQLLITLGIYVCSSQSDLSNPNLLLPSFWGIPQYVIIIKFFLVQFTITKLTIIFAAIGIESVQRYPKVALTLVSDYKSPKMTFLPFLVIQSQVVLDIWCFETKFDMKI